MSISTKPAAWLNQHPRTKQWLWFGALWCSGIITVVVLTYPLKLLIHHA